MEALNLQHNVVHSGCWQRSHFRFKTAGMRQSGNIHPIPAFMRALWAGRMALPIAVSSHSGGAVQFQ